MAQTAYVKVLAVVPEPAMINAEACEPRLKSVKLVPSARLASIMPLMTLYLCKVVFLALLAADNP